MILYSSANINIFFVYILSFRFFLEPFTMCLLIRINLSIQIILKYTQLFVEDYSLVSITPVHKERYSVYDLFHY
jgi:hypothetical protein